MILVMCICIVLNWVVFIEHVKILFLLSCTIFVIIVCKSDIFQVLLLQVVDDYLLINRAMNVNFSL